ncbi:MAG: threonine/serine dehydratase [Gemmatimonadaceae bacterium]
MFSDLKAVDVYAAAHRLRGVTTRTPLTRSPGLTEIAGGPVYLKLENEQVTGSFKVRGAFNAIALLPDAVRARGVVTSSAGNHGLGVAYAAQRFGIPATIFIPADAPAVKRDGIAALGATVDSESEDYDAAMRKARALAVREGLTYIHPCLGEPLLAGQGTVALEIIEELPDVATVVVPVGGAGLLGGMGSLLRRVAPAVRIVGAQSVNTAAMARSLAADAVIPIPSLATLADGLAGLIDDYALDIGRHTLDAMITLEESEISRAIAWLHREDAIYAEGSGAVGVAALLERRVNDLQSPVAIVITGANIDAARHALCR